MSDKKKWLVTHDSHALKKGEIYEGKDLPLWLEGKATLVSDAVFEVATPGDLTKLQADLDEAQKQLDELKKKAK